MIKVQGLQRVSRFQKFWVDTRVGPKLSVESWIVYPRKSKCMQIVFLFDINLFFCILRFCPVFQAWARILMLPPFLKECPFKMVWPTLTYGVGTGASLCLAIWVVMLLHSILSCAILPVSARVPKFLALQYVFMLSVHLLGGLPFGHVKPKWFKTG